jgi:hypothetical protein
MKHSRSAAIVERAWINRSAGAVDASLNAVMANRTGKSLEFEVVAERGVGAAPRQEHRALTSETNL